MYAILLVKSEKYEICIWQPCLFVPCSFEVSSGGGQGHPVYYQYREEIRSRSRSGRRQQRAVGAMAGAYRSCLHRSTQFTKQLSKLATSSSYVKHIDWTSGEYSKPESKGRRKYYLEAALLGSVLIGTAVSERSDATIKSTEISKDQNVEIRDDQNSKNETAFVAGEKRSDLPTYKSEEIMNHNTRDSLWVTYKHGVYDITKFLPEHPGGEQVLNAAGFSIEPFWNVYGMHKTPEIFELLESYRIGNLHEDDIVDHSGDELWVKEPLRDKRLLIKTQKPFNAEIPAKLQVQSLDTPNELFYVRQHMPVPELNVQEHSVKVIIKNGTTRTEDISLNELTSRFKVVSIRAALMCAGNRRSEMNKQVKPVKGISWLCGAISNAVWSGVYLRDVLLECGVDPDDVEGKHIVFTGSDIDATGVNFSTSIPLYMGLDPNAKILLATKMNGEQLPPDHGYPLRVIVPGAAAVRSVKWLESITVSYDESDSHWHQKDYRGFNPSKTWETADFSTAPPIYTLPVTSAICDPADGETVPVKDGFIEIRGYAYSGGGAKILRVDVTPDRGGNWVEAQAVAEDASPPRTHYSWLLWRAMVPVQIGQEDMELWVKATDSNFNTQPEKFEDIWNIRGVLSNAYHKIKIQLKHI